MISGVGIFGFFGGIMLLHHIVYTSLVKSSVFLDICLLYLSGADKSIACMRKLTDDVMGGMIVVCTVRADSPWLSCVRYEGDPFVVFPAQ